MQSNQSRYSHASHTDRVIKASSAKHSKRIVLLEACRRAEFDRPETTFTKDQVCDTTGLTRPTVQNALRALKAEGILKPIKNELGGRGKATTYALCMPSKGGKETPVVAEDASEARFRSLARKFGAKRALDMMAA